MFLVVSLSGLDDAMLDFGGSISAAAAYFSKTKVSVFATDDTFNVPASPGSEKDTSLLLGAGATWALTPILGLRLGYSRLQKAVAGEGDVDSLSLGIRVKF